MAAEGLDFRLYPDCHVQAWELYAVRRIYAEVKFAVLRNRDQYAVFEPTTCLSGLDKIKRA